VRLFLAKACLKTGKVTDSKGFFVVQVILTKECRRYFEEKGRSTAEKKR